MSIIRQSLYAFLTLAAGSEYAYAQISKSANASYSSDFTGSNPVSSFGGNLGYKISDTLSASVSQSITQKFYIYPSEDEFSLSDTVLSSSLKLGDYYSLNHSLSFSMTLPISKNSRRNEAYTNLGAGWSASHTPLEKLSLNYGISTRSYISKYQSQPSGDGFGGAPLPIYSVNYSHSGNYQFMPTLGFNYSLSNGRIWYYDLDPSKPGVNIANVPNDIFSASFGLSYSLSEQLELSAGVSKGNVIKQLDTVDLAIFDEQLSQWYSSLSFSF